MNWPKGKKKSETRPRRVRNFLSQPFSVAEVFSGIPGQYVPVDKTVDDFEKLLNGDYDDLPEQAFLLVGTIEDAINKAKKIEAES